MKYATIFALFILSLSYIPFTKAEDQSITYEPISIDGEYTEKVSPADRMKNLRAKLEKQNEILVKKKIESLRLKQEIEMTKRLQKIFNQQMQALESIN